MRTLPCLPALLPALDGLSLEKIWAFFALEWSKSLRQVQEMVREQDARFFFPTPFLEGAPV